MEYLFVVASLILVVGYIIIFQKIMNTITTGNEDTINIQKLQTQLFLRIAILEVIPIILIVFTFTTMSGSDLEGNQIILPIGIIAFTFLFGLIRTFLSYREAKGAIENPNVIKHLQQLFLISIPLMAAIPIICVVFLLTL